MSTPSACRSSSCFSASAITVPRPQAISAMSPPGSEDNTFTISGTSEGGTLKLFTSEWFAHSAITPWQSSRENIP